MTKKTQTKIKMKTSSLLEIPIKYEMIYDKIYKRNGLNVRKHPALAVKSTWPTSST